MKATQAAARPLRNRGRRKPYHHGNLRSALIEAASEILAAEGVDSLSLRETARRAGVSQTAPYRHFADKRALLAAVAAKGFREFAEGQAAADRQFSDPALRIQAMGVAYVSFATRHPALFRLMFSAEFADKTAYPELFDAGKASFMPFSQAVEERVGNSDTMRVDAGTAKVAGWALVHGLANLLLEGYGGKGITPRLDEPGLVDRATALFVRAIGPEAPDR